MADEFPGYYVVNGRKVTPHGEPYKKGKEDDPAVESPEVTELKAQLATAKAERDAALAAAEKPPAPPKPAPGITPPAS